MSILDDEEILVTNLTDTINSKYIKEHILKAKEGEDVFIKKLPSGNFQIHSYKQIELNTVLPIKIGSITTPTLSIYGPDGLSNIQNKQIALNGKNYVYTGYFNDNTNIENKKAAVSLYLNTGDTDEEIRDLNITSNIDNSSGICYIECFNKFKRFVNCSFLMGNAVPPECKETQTDQINNCIIDLTHTKIEDWNCFDGLTVRTKNKYTRVYINITSTPLAVKTIQRFKDNNINIDEYYRNYIQPHMKNIEGLCNIIFVINNKSCSYRTTKWRPDRLIKHLRNYVYDNNTVTYNECKFSKDTILYIPNIFLGYEMKCLTCIDNKWDYFIYNACDLQNMRRDLYIKQGKYYY